MSAGGERAVTGGVSNRGGDGYSSGGIAAAAGGSMASGGRGTSAVQQTCDDACAAMAGASIAKCKLKACSEECTAVYDDSGVASVPGCQDAFLLALTCGALQPSSSWTCDLGWPLPTAALDCAAVTTALAALPGCTDALVSAANSKPP